MLKAEAIAAGYANELWTLPRIGALIEARFGVKFTASGAWRNLRLTGWSVQWPSGQARQRGELAITTWKKRRWPALKNSGAAGANHRLYR